MGVVGKMAKSKAEPKTKKAKKVETLSKMKWMKSTGGNDLIVFDEYTYINFGKEKNIKWMHLSYIDTKGVRCGKIFPVTLNKVKKEFAVMMGEKNLENLRGLIKPRLEGEILSRKKFIEIGEHLNIEESK